jgi:trehalose synthase
MFDVHVPARSPAPFEALIGPERYGEFSQALVQAARRLEGRTVWNVNSTAKGGGVAEMLAPLDAYPRSAGIDARWTVIQAPPEFFEITKRLHNLLHGESGDGKPLTDLAREVYVRSLAPSGDELASRVRPNDLVIVHDPQPAGLIPILKARTGARVVWRCHVGIDEPDDVARAAWDFLRPFVTPADRYVFSRAGYAWEGLDPRRVDVIPPSIDALSPKNAPMDPTVARGVLRAARLVDDGPGAEPWFERTDGSGSLVERPATVVEDAPIPAGAPVVLQVSRWDRLKDPSGVMEGFARFVPIELGAHLVLAGPRSAEVADDPESDEVLRAVREARDSLPSETRGRVHLASLPMEDDEENATIVNALQRRADVVVQKSLREGFGLTVAEAMWKGRPVVASRVGGIQDQIVDGESGVLVDDPRDLRSFGEAVAGLLRDPERGRRMGAAAHARIRDEFLPPGHLMKWDRTLQAADREGETEGLTAGEPT